MKLRGGQQLEFNQIKENIYEALSQTSFPTTIYRTIENIVYIITAIRQTKGKEWASTVVNDRGIPLLTAAEQIQFTNALQPYIGIILSFFDEEMPNYLHQGGESKGMAVLQDRFKNSVSDKMSSHMDSISTSDFDPDTLFGKIMSTFQSVNKTMNETAEQVHFEKAFDDDMDIPLGNTGIFVPPRLISFLVYMVLDISRIAVSMTGNENGRKILSVLVALVELLRGNWKKAVLTFIGYFGMSPFYIGQLLKTILTVIQMLSPAIQVKLPYFMYDSVKSLLFGLILTVIQIGAPQAVRNQIKTLADRLNLVQDDINTKLDALSPPLSERPDYLKLDFSNLNHLQSIMDDPVYICSKEHREAVDSLLQQPGSTMNKFILSFIRYPHTPDMTKFKCDSNTATPYVDLLVAEGLKREEVEKEAKQVAEVEPVVEAEVEPVVEAEAKPVEAKPVAAVAQVAQVPEAKPEAKPVAEQVAEAKPVAVAKVEGGAKRTLRRKRLLRIKSLKKSPPLEHLPIDE